MTELEQPTSSSQSSAPAGASTDIRALNEKIKEKSQFLSLIDSELRKAVIGQNYMIERLLLGLLSGGHVLLEGVPGLAKTLSMKAYFLQ